MEERAVTPTWRKSSYSANGGEACVEVGSIPWRKSTHSANGGGNCVEAAHTRGTILIRDTKNGGAGPVLRVSAETWRTFLTTLRR
jgi:hypothetical protein